MEKSTHSTIYSFVYSNDKRNIIDAETFSNTGYPVGYYVAAVKEIYNKGKLTSIDQVINSENWVNADIENAKELALNLRKSNNKHEKI